MDATTMTMARPPTSKPTTTAAGVGNPRIQGVLIGEEHLEVIEADQAGVDAVCYPQTQAAVECAGASDDASIKSPSSTDSQPEEKGATLSSLVQAAVTSLSIQPSIMQPMAAPPLVMGDQLENYTITETIVQGWLYKKGTGGDWAGSRGWKPRWVTLALAKNPDSIVPMPILLSHRAPGVPYPANIIELTESTVIMATERKLGETGPGTKIDSTEGEKQKVVTPAEEEWNKHCFQIVHTQHKDTIPTPKTTTRIFTAPLLERNEWVFAMNSALIAYVKHLGRTRKNEAARHEFRIKNEGGVEYDKSILGDEAEDEKREQLRQQPKRSPSPFVNDLMGLPSNHPIRPVQSWDI